MRVALSQLNPRVCCLEPDQIYSKGAAQSKGQSKKTFRDDFLMHTEGATLHAFAIFGVCDLTCMCGLVLPHTSCTDPKTPS
jgi:hypothetical protein